MMADFCWMLRRDVTKKKTYSRQSIKKRFFTKKKLLNFVLLIVKKPDVIQKNEGYFCNQGSNIIQNQLSKSKHRLKSFVLQACVILIMNLESFAYCMFSDWVHKRRNIFIFDFTQKLQRNNRKDILLFFLKNQTIIVF
jgi:hypothetical protein